MAAKFPYESFRPGQREVAENVARTVKEGAVLLLQAPTGFGKTAAVIYGLLQAGVERVLYVVRTRNEIQPVVRELKRFGVRFTFLYSARRMCPLFRSRGGDEEESSPSVEEFWENCRAARLRGVCQYYANLESVSVSSVRSIVDEAEADPYLTVALLTSYKLCPFFALKMLIDDSVFIVATYPYLFNPDIFTSIFEPKEYSDFVIVVDEAHSLMEAHTMVERRLSIADLEKAMREVREKYGEGSEEYRRLERLRSILKAPGKGMKRIDAKRVLDALGDPEEWDSIANEIRVERLMEALESGSSVKVYTARIALIAEAAAAGYRAYIDSSSGRPVLRLLPVDPCRVTEQPLNSSKAAILMSGTMPPSSYVRDVLCVHKQIRVYDVELFHPAVKASYASARRVIVAAEPTSKYVERGERMYNLYALYIAEALSLTGGRAALLVFPSYEFMSHIVSRLPENIRKEMIVEEQATTITEVQEAIRNGDARIVAAVAGGKLVEGVEYVDSEGRSLLGLVFVAGVPYPQPDPIFEDYVSTLAERVGEEQARDYAFNVSAAIRVRQAIGRAQRRPGDRVVVVLADRRFLYRRIKELLKLKYDRIVFSVDGLRKALKTALEELGLAATAEQH